MKQRRQIISHIPQRGMTGREWGLAVENELVPMWLSELSAAERERLAERGMGQASPAAFLKLDRIILEQAETLSWRIGLSELVQFRFSEWDRAPDGPDKHKKYGAACARAARIMQRQELPPVTDPEQWAVKRETVTELRLVLKRMRATLALNRKTPSRSDVNTLFFRLIAESPELVHLRANIERWQKFIEQTPLRPDAESRRTMPGDLYDQFLASSTGWEQESLRQTIARLKPKL
jgi:hypothetical protein